jgi:gliding motility-associated-like protein
MRPPVPAFAGNDTTAVIGVPHQLRATGGINYLWLPAGPLNNPSGPNPLATLQKDTRFTVRVTDFAGCVGTDTIFVRVYDGITYYIPNAFSPNGDGLNDVFRPIPVGIVSTDWFRIYNRYGEIIFETTKWMEGWDGSFKGTKQPVGNYVWIIKGRGRNGKVIEMRGNVVLVR